MGIIYELRLEQEEEYCRIRAALIQGKATLSWDQIKLSMFKEKSTNEHEVHLKQGIDKTKQEAHRVILLVYFSNLYFPTFCM